MYKAVKGDKYKQKLFFHNKMSHIQLIYAFLSFWSFFREIHWKLLFLIQKLTISVRSSEILRKFVFLNKFEKEEILRKIWLILNNPFCTKQENGTNINKTVFLHKMSHVPPNYAFLMFLSNFGLIHRKILFLVKKVTLSERGSEILTKFVFLNKFEKGQTKRKIWICLQNFFLI